MKEIGVINQDLATAIAKQGHGDLLMVTDAGFAILPGIEVIDLSLDENKSMVFEVLAVLKKYFSVKKNGYGQSDKGNSILHANILNAFGEGVPVESVKHTTIKEMSKTVKTVIRAGDFISYGNVILVSGAENRWFVDKES